MAKKFYPGNYYPARDRGQAIPFPSASFEELANACLARAQTLVPQWLPHGHREGDNGIADDPVRSGYVIRVNLKTGAWTRRPRRVIQ